MGSGVLGEEDEELLLSRGGGGRSVISGGSEVCGKGGGQPVFQREAGVPRRSCTDHKHSHAGWHGRRCLNHESKHGLTSSIHE